LAFSIDEIGRRRTAQSVQSLRITFTPLYRQGIAVDYIWNEPQQLYYRRKASIIAAVPSYTLSNSALTTSFW
jgi:hypothetical protein